MPEESDSLGGPSYISPTSTLSEQVVMPEAVVSSADEALIATVDALIPDMLLKSLSGSFREGMVRCLVDLTETYPDPCWYARCDTWTLQIFVGRP